ncbi:hypothetical protein Val02_45730 [Virgisporangium aliadipatigenens]|uniref:Uncharacterized protein n=1 Tax=Virgisporangium aliadipatigenens TaxID=741659 RepID=A0A8J3YNI7_9ACTN|nr:hypothetical protein [Virgisporangium aliadipatigenens]GIJ47687.1 hypothetical protein Val02_45730 [Virgisporangium aliadipatigenens]
MSNPSPHTSTAGSDPPAVAPRDLGIALLWQLAGLYGPAPGGASGVAAVVPPGPGRAVPAARLLDLDPEAVARWLAARYPARLYPAAVIGSPHGAAVHLAAALGGVWLPGGFGLRVEPGARVRESGGSRIRAPLEALLRRHPGVRLYESDATGPGPSTVDLTVKWTSMPAAYTSFLRERLRPGAPVAVFADCRCRATSRISSAHLRQGREPHRDRVDCFDFPAGTGVTSPFMRAVRRYGVDHGHPVRVMLMTEPAVLSASVANLYRGWLRGYGRPADRLVIQTGRHLAPGLVRTAGLVPYWSSALHGPDLEALEYWLAGSRPFADIRLPDPAGTDPEAGPTHRRRLTALLGFGGSDGELPPPPPPAELPAMPWSFAMEWIRRYSDYGGLLPL